MPHGSHVLNEVPGDDILDDRDDPMQDDLDPPEFARPHMKKSLFSYSRPDRDLEMTEREKNYLPQVRNAEAIRPPGLSGPRINRNVVDGGPRPQNTLGGSKGLMSFQYSGKKRQSDVHGASSKNSRTKKSKLDGGRAPEVLSVDSDDDDDLTSRNAPHVTRGVTRGVTGLDRRKASEAQHSRLVRASVSRSTSNLSSPIEEVSPIGSKHFLQKGSQPVRNGDHASVRHATPKDSKSPASREMSTDELACSQPQPISRTAQERNPQNRWSSSTKGASQWSGAKTARHTSHTKLCPLVSFQRGAQIERPASENPEGSLSMEISVNELKKGAPVQFYLLACRNSDPISSIHATEPLNLDVHSTKIIQTFVQANRPTRFHFKMHKDIRRHGGDIFVLFEMQDADDAKYIEQLVDGAGFTLEKCNDDYFYTVENNLRLWQRKADAPPPRKEADNAVTGKERKLMSQQQAAQAVQDHKFALQMRESENKRRIKQVQRDPSVVIHTSPHNAPKTRSSTKRSRSTEEDIDSDIPIRAARVPKRETPKLVLPTPAWQRPLLYPFEGPKRENVDYEDLNRLNPAQLLNDNIMNFYLRYLELELAKCNPSVARETHFLNTFFYTNLSKHRGPKQDMSAVLKWTAKIDLFQKNYIILPINEATHWYVAIICNLQHLSRKLKPNETPTENEKVPDNHIEDPDGTVAAEAPPIEVSVEDSVEAPSISNGGGTQNDPHLIETQESMRRMSIESESKGSKGWPDEGDLEGVAVVPQSKSTPKTERISIKDDNIAIANGAASEIQRESNAKARAGSDKNSRQRKSRYDRPLNTPVIVILDSMSMNTQRQPTIKNIRDWLAVEASVNRGIDMDAKTAVDATFAKVPTQDNWYDCGLYVLWYVQRFIQDPTRFLKTFLARQNTKVDHDLWPQTECASMRKHIFDIIVKLHDEYEEHVKTRKPKAKPQSKASKPESQAPKDVEKTDFPTAETPLPDPEIQLLAESEANIANSPTPEKEAWSGKSLLDKALEADEDEQKRDATGDLPDDITCFAPAAAANESTYSVIKVETNKLSGSSPKQPSLSSHWEQDIASSDREDQDSDKR